MNPVSASFAEQRLVLEQWVRFALDRLTNDDLALEIIPGRNHGVWILGHLIASDDDLSLFLGKGPLLFPEYQALFAQGCPCRAAGEYPSPDLLREQWDAVCAKNTRIHAALTDDELDLPHDMVEGNPADDYFGTKARVIMHWHMHQAYEAGQLALLAAKVGKSVL
jgi:hypothetical protein